LKPLLSLEESTPLSFFSSGFPSHVHGEAVDVSSPDMETFIAPFSGTLLHSEKVKVGRPNRHAKVNYDVVSFLEVNGYKVKMLHVEPFLSVGQTFRKGEAIGKFLSTPYTGGDFPHAHLEGITFRIPRLTEDKLSSVGKVLKVEEDFFDVQVVDYAKAGKIHGLGVSKGILNVSYPFACYGGILGEYTSLGQRVEIQDLPMGYVVKKIKRIAFLFEWKTGAISSWDYDLSFKVLVNEPLCGSPFMEAVLSYGGYPLIRFFMKSEFKEGDEVNLYQLFSRCKKCWG